MSEGSRSFFTLCGSAAASPASCGWSREGDGGLGQGLSAEGAARGLWASHSWGALCSRVSRQVLAAASDSAPDTTPPEQASGAESQGAPQESTDASSPQDSEPEPPAPQAEPTWDPKEELFRDPAEVLGTCAEVDYLEQFGASSFQASTLRKQSLYLKFDPLLKESPQRPVPPSPGPCTSAQETLLPAPTSQAPP